MISTSSSPLAGPTPTAALYRQMRPYRWAIAGGAVATLGLGLASSGLGLLVAPLLRLLASDAATSVPINELFGPHLAAMVARLGGAASYQSAELLAIFPALLVSVGGLKWIMTVTQGYLWELTAEGVCRDLRQRAVALWLAAPVAAQRSSPFRATQETLSSNLTHDLRLVRDLIAQFYGGLPRIVVENVCLGIALFLLSPGLLALFGFLVFPAAIAVRRSARKLATRSGAVLSGYTELSEWVQTRLLGLESIKQLATEEFELAQLRQRSDAYVAQQLRAARARAQISPLIEAGSLLALTSALGLACWGIAQGWLQPVVTLSFFITLGLLVKNSGSLGRYVAVRQAAAPALQRTVSLQQRLEAVGDEYRRSAPGTAPLLRCRALVLGYAQSCVLTGVSFEVAAGEVLTLKGPSGCGKTSLLQSILGWLAPHSGEIIFGGQGLHAEVAYVPQHVYLPPRSLAEYLDATSPEQAWEALRQVGLEAWAQQLPSGLQTPIGEGCRAVSGGQGQRLALARLWTRRPQLVLLDEATAGLDPATEQQVLTRLTQRVQELAAAVIVISHRPTERWTGGRILSLTSA